MAITLFVACRSPGSGPRNDGGGGDVANDRSTPADAGADRGDTRVCPTTGVGTAINGEMCACNSDCSSGNCVDGFCCNTKCGDTCHSCSLPETLGTCTPVPAGVPPSVASQCVKTDATSCGLDGTCDGAGKCRQYESGTVCRPGTCEADSVSGRYTCDGQGSCKLGATVVCAPHSCNRATNQCFDNCTSDADCVTGVKCVGGTCGLKMNGAVCSAGSECASTFCADIVNGKGVCCNSACGGACRSCSLVSSPGACMPIPAGQGHPMCAKQAAMTCGSTGVCDGFGSCTVYPTGTPCGAATCATATSVKTASSCDGLGTCQAAETLECGSFKCVNGACNSKCTTNADCKDGIACMNGTCGPKLDGQPCSANSECQNAHCVKDSATGPGICCNTDCTGGCRSCALASAPGRCTLVAAGAADPRMTCTDMTAATCGTDGKCDGAGACRRYAVGTVCAGEACANDVYNGPSTCNASGQCIKPASQPCFPYHCNANRCFTACTTSAQCIAPNICGMNGVISSCGLKPNGAACSSANECTSKFCAQGVCCNAACTAACKSCNLAGSVGSCSNVNSGADPGGRCPATAANTCGTTGQCSNGNCAFHAAGTQCMGAACPTASTRRPPSTCNGSGACNTPATTNCAPGRCDSATSNCTNTCTVGAANQCTAPAMCVGGSCGLLPIPGSCTANNQCASGQCYLAEGSPGVCCNSACSGTCESCRVTGSVGTCTAIAAGAADPDPATACVAAANPMTCGLNGRCAGNNNATNGAGTTRCQFFGSAQGCRAQACTPGTATAAATVVQAASCNGAGACPAMVTASCGNYNKCNGTSCATSCMADADCIGGVACNTQTKRCGDKLPNGQVCSAGTDCTSGNCVDGVCCNSACTGNCQACNAAGTVGTCTNVPAMCNDGNPCNGVENTCTAAGVCQPGTPVVCAESACRAAGTCNPMTGQCSMGAVKTGPCTSGTNMCVTGQTCQTDGTCGGGTTKTCAAATECRAAETCNPTTGLCVAGAPMTGEMCSTGNMCITGQTCQSNGTCAGGTTKTCAAETTCRAAETCSATTGDCVAGAPKTGSCRAAVCTPGAAGAAASVVAGASCSGGMCPPAGTPTSCGDYTKCNGTACATTCSGNGDCVAPKVCNGTTCGDPKSPNGDSCTNNNDCVSGNCVGTGNARVCCNSACTGECQVCSTGTCSPSNALCPSDNNTCNGTETCGTNGMCTSTNAPAPGTSCNGGMGMCMGGNCVANPPATGGADGNQGTGGNTAPTGG